MKKFFHQILVGMSDTFYRATDDKKMTETMKDFCAYFAEKMDIEDAKPNDDKKYKAVILLQCQFWHKKTAYSIVPTKFSALKLTNVIFVI